MSSENDDQTLASVSKSHPSEGFAGGRRCPKCGLAVSDTTMVCPVDNTAIFEAPGTVLADSYEIIGVSGWGGMSVIYKARQRETGRVVAIKMLHSLLASEKSLRRFKQEAEAITSLRHQNIITVYDFGVSEHGQPYMVMEFIEGKTLADVIKEAGGLSLEASLPRFIQLCDALDHAHAVGVLHRDLKPSNIMISNLAGDFEDAKIVDFGIAKMLDKEGEDKDVGHLTQTGELFGSPLYMSPEQCRGKTVDGRTDIYSMGCVMYETLTGHPPFRGETIVETLMMQVSETPKSLTEASNGKRFSREIEEVIAKALSKSPEDRYQDMRQMVLALMSIQPNKEDDAQPLSANKSRKSVSIPNFVYAGAPAFLLLAVVLSAWWYGHSNQLATDSKLKNNELPQLRNDLKLAQQKQKFISDALQKLYQGNRKGVNDHLLQQACSNGDLLLGELDLNDTNVTDAGTKSLPSQKSLHGVYLENTPIGDLTVRYLQLLPNLELLTLRNVQLTDHSFGNTPVYKHIQKLYLNYTRGIGDKSLDKITQINSLEELDITGASITDHGCAVLQRTNLTKLWLGHTAFGDEGIHSLKNTSRMTDLYFGDTKVTDAGFAELKAPSLVQLEISHTKITEKGLRLLERYPTLNTLRVNQMPFNDSHAEAIEKMRGLERVSLAATKITDKTLRTLANLPKLKESVLNENQDITDAGIESLSHSNLLVHLDLSSTKITDTSLKHLSRLKTLQELYLLECPNLTLNGVREFQIAHPKCKVVVIAQAPTAIK